MKPTLSVSFWIEAGLAAATGILAVVSIFWQDWIEVLTGFDPDAHDGSVEWMTVIALAIVCAVFSTAAQAERRRANAGLSAARP
jgi:undecaprenyl pyrophosphate phosphatase UppP